MRGIKYVQDLCLLKQIENGYYGRMYYGVDNKNKKQCAIKMIPVQRLREYPKLQSAIFQQVTILSRLAIVQDCQHIIRYYQLMKTPNNYYLALQYCNEGTLYELIRRKEKLQQQEALIIFKQLLQAFKVLRKHKIFHKNFKTQKILLHDGKVKLFSFSFSSQMIQQRQINRGGCIIGFHFDAPQYLLQNSIEIQLQNIWSLGVILYQMLFGDYPWKMNHPSYQQYFKFLKKDKINFPPDSTDVSPFVKRLIERMLKYYPKQRISWQELFQIKISSQGKIIQQQYYQKMNIQEKVHQFNISSQKESYQKKRQAN